MARKIEGVTLPSTLERSPPKAQRTFAKTLKSAEAEYGAGERAGRTAYGALKHSFEKLRPAESFGGVDVLGHTRDELYERAKGMGIAGRSAMSKQELARAIAKKQR